MKNKKETKGSLLACILALSLVAAVSGFSVVVLQFLFVWGIRLSNEGNYFPGNLFYFAPPIILTYIFYDYILEKLTNKQK